MRIKVISFDAGGTLLSPYPSVGAIYGERMAAHGLDIPADTLNARFREAFRAARGKPRDTLDADHEKQWWRELVRAVIDGLGEPDDFHAMFEDLWWSFAAAHRWRLHAGTEETLCELRKRGYRLCLLSNWDGRLRPLLAELGLLDAFDEIVISCEVGFEKPDPRIFAHAQERFAVSAQEILHVGDSDWHDCKGAQNAGWQAIRIRHDTPATDGVICELRSLLHHAALR
jgi:putative hydrolase of the HAD superfamily